ncbi:MAG: hypothetical protein IJE43_04040 [Alphaproteobacteria bacterium]|nr:hypothetical protein [Alphaproteobacteria bacterium]MCI5509041.1 hypothetical protein [Eubacterium sp.]
MEFSISSAINSVNTKYNVSLSNGELDWTMIPSARKSNKSQTKFVDEIKELARKAANTTSKTELEYIHRKRTELCAEYMSDVSPNRKALYQQAKNAMKSESSNPKCQGIGELTLLDFLEAAEGKRGNLAEKKFTLAGGGTLVCPILTSGGYGADIYYQGTKVLTYLGSGYGWACERTPAEREKEKEFYGIYFKEYRTLKNGKGLELEELPDYLEEKPSFDMKA